MLKPDIAAVRKADYPCDDQFLNRWSPRAMSGEPLTRQELMSIFEAGRWAPSSYNDQPWRFVYAVRGTPHWQRLFDLLVPQNQAGCVNAAALVCFVSRETFEQGGKPNKVHTFDTGSAWMSMALQASLMGLVAHGMAGFDSDRARRDLNVPDGWKVEAMCAFGRPGRKEDLPEALRQREAPSPRKPVSEIARDGMFGV
jgi:nitroreductase